MECPFNHVIQSTSLIIGNADLYYLAEVVFVRFLHCEVTLCLPYSFLWKEITMYSPHLRSWGRGMRLAEEGSLGDHVHRAPSVLALESGCVLGVGWGVVVSSDPTTGAESGVPSLCPWAQRGRHSVSPKDRGLPQSPLHPVSPVTGMVDCQRCFISVVPAQWPWGSHHPPRSSGSPTPRETWRYHSATGSFPA